MRKVGNLKDSGIIKWVSFIIKINMETKNKVYNGFFNNPKEIILTFKTWDSILMLSNFYKSK